MCARAHRGRAHRALTEPGLDAPRARYPPRPGAQPRPLAALVEVLVAPLLRVVALYTTWDFNRVARKAVAKERAEASN